MKVRTLLFFTARLAGVACCATQIIDLGCIPSVSYLAVWEGIASFVLIAYLVSLWAHIAHVVEVS